MRADTRISRPAAAPVMPPPDEVTTAAETFQLLGDPTRLRILWALLQRECSVSQLARFADAQPAAVSQHLAKLRLARLVRPRREGAHMFYTAESGHVRTLLTECLRHAEHVGKGRSEDVHTPRNTVGKRGEHAGPPPGMPAPAQPKTRR